MLENSSFKLYLCDMILDLEKLRGKMTKAEFARLAGISTAQYYNYLQGANIPFKVVKQLVENLGYEIAIIKRL